MSELADLQAQNPIRLVFLAKPVLVAERAEAEWPMKQNLCPGRTLKSFS